MANLKRIVQIDNVEDAGAVDAAIEKVKRVCASGLATGAAKLSIEFDAPDVEARRRRVDADDVEGEEPVAEPKPRRTRAAAVASET